MTRLISRFRGADLRDVDLGAMELRGRDLSGCDLRGVDLSGRCLAGADLTGARLDGAVLVGTDFRDSLLIGASLCDARADRAQFDRSVGSDVNAVGICAPEASFVGADWPRARLSRGRLEGVIARGARFDGAALEGAVLVRADLHRAVLDDASLEGATLDHVRASRVALRGARGRFLLHGADLRGADLRDLPLLDLDLTDVRMEGAVVDAHLARHHAALLRARGWAPSAARRLTAHLTAVVASNLGAFRGRTIPGWIERFRRPAAPALDSAPADPDDEWTDEDAFAEAAFARDRVNLASAFARSRSARRSLAARRAAAAAERLPAVRAAAISAVPSEIFDAFRDGTAARLRAEEGGSLARDAQARAAVRQGWSRTSTLRAAATLRREAAERGEAAAQAVRAWQARLEAVQEAETVARREALRRRVEEAELRRETQERAAEEALRRRVEEAELRRETQERAAEEARRTAVEEHERARVEAAAAARAAAEARTRADEEDASIAAAMRVAEQNARLEAEAVAAVEARARAEEWEAAAELERSAAEERLAMLRVRVDIGRTVAARAIEARRRDEAAAAQATVARLVREAEARAEALEASRIVEAQAQEFLAEVERRRDAEATAEAERDRVAAEESVRAHTAAAEQERLAAIERLENLLAHVDIGRAAATRAVDARRRAVAEAARDAAIRSAREAEEMAEEAERTIEAKAAALESARVAEALAQAEAEEAVRLAAHLRAAAAARAATAAWVAAAAAAQKEFETAALCESLARAAAEEGEAERLRRAAAEVARSEAAVRREAELRALREAELFAREAARAGLERLASAAEAARRQRREEDRARLAAEVAARAAEDARLSRLRTLGIRLVSRRAAEDRTARAVVFEAIEAHRARAMEAAAEERDEAGARAAAAVARRLANVGLPLATRLRDGAASWAFQIKAALQAPLPEALGARERSERSSERRAAAMARWVRGVHARRQRLDATRGGLWLLTRPLSGALGVAALGGATAQWSTGRLSALLRELKAPVVDVDALARQASARAEREESRRADRLARAAVRRVLRAERIARLVDAAREGIIPLLQALRDLVEALLGPIGRAAEELAAATTRDNLRGLSTWVWGAVEEEGAAIQTLEEWMQFSRDARMRGDITLFRARRRSDAVRAQARAHSHERRFGGAPLLAASAAREEARRARAARRHGRALACARRLRDEDERVAWSLVEAGRRRDATTSRRALAEEARHAQVAREAARRLLREEAELARRDAAAQVVEERIRRVEQEIAAGEAGGADSSLLGELAARLGARAQERTAQRARVDEARQLQQVTGEAAASGRRRLLSAVRAGVGRLRRGFGEVPLDLRPGVDLSARSLDERDLAGADLRDANLRGSTLVGADLRRTDLRGADLTDVDFTGARLEGARLEGACLDGAVLDQVLVTGTLFADVRATGARLGAMRGLSPAGRQALIAGGAETPAGDGRGAGWVAAAVALTVAVSLGFYQYGKSTRVLDDGSLQQAATEAQHAGDAAGAALAFSQLAAGATDTAMRVDYYLQEAMAHEDAGKPDLALDALDKAVAAAAGAEGEMPRALLARAEAKSRLGLQTDAAIELRALLARADATPDQSAQAIVSLRQALGAAGIEEGARLQASRLAAMSTDPQRSAFCLALADAWAAVNDLASVRSALDAGLALVEGVDERTELRLRLARVMADLGDTEAALAAYADLADGTRGADARLGAAELLERVGRGADARALLTPLLDSPEPDIRARALMSLATTSERTGDTAAALAGVRSILELQGVPPSVMDGARILLARLDPTAVDGLVAQNPAIRSELLMGRAHELLEAGERTDAHEIWVGIAEDSTVDPQTRVDASLSLAQMQVEDGDMKGAVERYDVLLATAALSRDARGRVSLGRSNALLRANRVQEAEAAFRALLATGTPEVQDQCRLGLARAQELRGNTAAAGELYVAVGRSTGPWSLEALLALGRLRESTDDQAGAIEAYRLATRKPGVEASRRTAAEIALAHALAASGDEAGAAQVYASLLEAPDAEVRVQARLAVAEAKLGEDPAAARTLLEAALAEAAAGPDRNSARALWVHAALATGDAALARTRLAAWLDTEGDAGARDELVAGALRALRSEGRLDDAAEIAVKWSAAGFEAGMEAALTLREAGRAVEAATVLKDMTPTTADDRLWRDEVYAEVLVDVDDLDAADAVWDRVATTHPDAARFGRGRVARLRGDNEEAIALLAGSNDPRAAEERGLAQEGLARFDEADASYASLLGSADPERRTAGRVGQARVRLARDDARGALTVLAKLTSVEAGYTLTVAQLRGDALLALGQVNDARDVYGGLDGDAEARTVRALGLGECALAEEDPRAAALSFAAALEGTADRYYQAEARAGLVRARMEGGKSDLAAAEYDRLREDYPEFPEAIARAGAAVGK